MLGIQARYFVVSPNREQLIEIGKLVDTGILQPAIAGVFPLSHPREAFKRSLIPHGAGKIILRIAGEQSGCGPR